MAGSYPDALGARIAYDRLNCTLLRVNSATDIVAYSSAQVTGMNGEVSGSPSLGDSVNIALIFPVPYDLTHIYLFTGNTASVTVKASADTTNGYDGTWSTVRAGMDYKSASSSVISPSYRTQYALTGASGVKAIRLEPSGATVFNVLHVYGQPSSSYTDRLALWHPTLDQPLTSTPAHLDYGDVARGTAPTKQFRVKNLSAALTAGSITVGAEALTDTTPTFVSQTTFSNNGGAYASTASIASLAPGGISPVITAKLTTSGSTALGLYAQRYFATAASWS